MGAVRIVDYQPAWATLYERESEKILRACGDLVQSVEHIGSTSVPGLAAKPIVDILVGVRESAQLSTIAEKTGTAGTKVDIEPKGNDSHVRLIEGIKKLGYAYRGENGIPKRLYLEVHEPDREVHVHVVKRSSDIWRNHLLFRDYLRAHPDVAKQYGEFKRKLAEQYREDRAGYTDAKAGFIKQCIRAAQSWVSGR